MLSRHEAEQVRRKLRAAAYTNRGVDWEKLFKFYNSSRSGTGEIGLVEFRRLLRNDAKISVSQLSDVNVKSLFNSVDLDGSGMIDADEFMTWVKGNEDEEDKDSAPKSRSSPDSSSLQQREWGGSSGYGRVSPRKLASPSQRRYDMDKGWVINNDENSEAEGAKIRRSNSGALKALLKSKEEGGPATSTGAPNSDDAAHEGVTGSASPLPGSPSFIGIIPETDSELLSKCQAKLEALQIEHATRLGELSEARDEISKLREMLVAREEKIKEQRKTIAILNRR